MPSDVVLAAHLVPLSTLLTCMFVYDNFTATYKVSQEDILNI